MSVLTRLAIILLSAILIWAATGQARSADQTEPAAERQGGTLAYLERLPPLLDRELFFDDPEIASPQISPDGRFMTFMKPHQEVRNIWIKALDEPFDAARPLTADDRPVPGYFWSQDSKYVLYVQDRDGDENFHVWAVDPSVEPEEDSGVPPARNLTDIEGVRALIYAVPKATPERILVGLNDRDPALHDVYEVDLATGEREMLIQNDHNVAQWTTDLDGTVRLAVRQTADGGTETLRVEDGELGGALYSCTWLESCGPMRFHPDGERVWFQSNRGEDRDLTALFLMDAATGETTLVESDPEGEVDFGGAMFSNATDELLATYYTGDRRRIYPRNERFEAALALLREQLPEGQIGFSPQTLDDRLVLVTLSRDVDPGTVYLFDWEGNTLDKQFEYRPELASEHLAEMTPVRYTARDGLEIPAYLTVPRGVEPENLAVVTLVHGGPWARDSWGYRSIVQFLANRGYAVLQPNFRGSSGFGKAFLNAGNNEWGDAMQHDVTDGVAWLVEQGVADPDRVCIMGGSYGGYATLAGMTFTPELYACGVNIVGPSNLITLLNSIPPYWGPVRQLFTLRMGDPATEEGLERLKRQSPIHSVESIQRPLLVIHGANDPRVKQAEADQIVVAMRERELPVEYIVAPDEGHGFRGRENRLAMFARTEEFLAEHLGGRYQDSMAEAIAARLAEISVDVETVEPPEEASGLDAARTLPLPAVDPAAVRTGSMRYTTTLELQDREMELDSERSVEFAEHDGRRVLRISSTASGPPMGEASETFLLDASSLRPIRRSVTQGPATIEIEYGSRKVTGMIEAGDQQIPIELELDAPAFAGESAFEAVLAGMPLETGYRTSVRTTELGMHHRVRYFHVEVAGRETVEVPAGRFESWRVELEPLDGEGGAKTYWLTVDPPRVMVRSEGRLPPEAGGGAFTTVLAALPRD